MRGRFPDDQFRSIQDPASCAEIARVMGSAPSPSTAIAMIAAMITPALLILGSASLVATVLVRMARVVDRARALVAIASEGGWERIGATPATLRLWLDRHASRARYAERSLALLYAAVVVFIATCLAIALDRVTGELLAWLPVSLALLGTLLLLAGGAWMLAESRLSGAQIQEEIRLAIKRLEEKT
jgi:hypothetical protein